MTLEYLKFHAVPKNGSLIGFISFKCGRDYSFFELAVHKLREKQGNRTIRLVYPEKQSPNREMQQFFDSEINGWLCANYPEVIKEAYAKV